MADADFIPSIFNYCDRWCERCVFTSRCRVFADEQSRVPLSDDPVEDAILTVAQSFAEAIEMLKENAEKFGIDLEAANDPELHKEIEHQREVVESMPLVQTAKDYALESMSLLSNSDALMVDHEDSLVEDMLSIVEWYQLFIVAKLHRGYHGIFDLDGEEDTNQLRDPESDTNGSVKAGLIAIDNSILAWTYLLSDSNAEILRPMIKKLEEIRASAEKDFPIARDFIRPGFDEIQTVM